MSLALPSQATSTSKALVIAHFDAHGVSTGAALAAALRARILSRFPDTGPQKLAQYIAALDLYDTYVHIVDIPINVAAPREHIAALEDAAARARRLVMWDHHETDLRYIAELQRVELRYFSTATDMALAIAQLHEDPRYHELLYVGVVADRDSSILRVVDRETVEKRLLPMANTLDVLVRRDAQAVAEQLLASATQPLQSASVDYPPYRLAQQLQVLRRGASTLLLAPVDLDTARSTGLETWLPKTLEQLLLSTGRDYAVIASEAEDRRTGQRFWSVRVVKYWLSDRPSPASLLRQHPEIQGRQVVGHEDYISIRAVDRQDAERLAQQVYEHLEHPVSQAARLVSDTVVSQAIQSDYNRILGLLERIASALERGAEAKQQQVELLRDLYQRDERARYD